MTTIDITSNFWMGYHEETAFAAGAGAAEFAQTALIDTLTSIDRIISCEISSFAAPVRDEEFDMGSGLTPSAIADLAKGPGEIVLTTYLQTDNLYDYSISADAIGSLGTSIALHIDDGIAEKDFFGCVVKEIVLESEVKSPTKQTITFLYRDQGDGSALTKVAYTSSAISVHKNVTSTIDAHTSSNLRMQKITQTITNTLDEDGYMLGDEAITDPRLIERVVEIEIEYKDRDSNTWGAGYTATANADELKAVTYFDAEIVWHTSLTSTMTNVYLKETTSGIRSEHGIIKHSAIFRRGVGFTIA